jgi:hypothetical protein
MVRRANRIAELATTKLKCPLLALSGHANGAEQCLLSGAKRTSPKDGATSAYDPAADIRKLFRGPLY